MSQEEHEEADDKAETGVGAFPLRYRLLGGAGAWVLVQLVLLLIFPPAKAFGVALAILVFAGILGFAAGALWAVGVMFTIDPGKAVLILLFLPLGLTFVPALSAEQRARFDGPADCIKWSLVVLLLIAPALGMIVGFMTMKWV